MSEKLHQLHTTVTQSLGDRILKVLSAFNELTLEVSSAHYVEVCRMLRDQPGLQFEQLIDLCGVDYSTYKNEYRENQRFAVTVHLLSISQNARIRVRVFCEDNDFPVVDSLTELWSSAGWYEREAFDLYGIVFEGHTDLRRLLTDYGFIGHAFRKDFPLSGYVEMRYDPQQKRVIYQPVTIEPREVTPRIVRENQYGSGR